MQRVKVPCQICGKSISKSNLSKHETACKLASEKPNYLPQDGSLNCIFCGKACKNLNSLVNHSRLCKANPQRQLNTGLVQFNAKRDAGQADSWNKGLTKETDGRVKSVSDKLREYYTTHAGTGAGRIWTEESRKKASLAATKGNLIKFERPSGRGHRGYYKGIYCQSSWELAYVLYSLDHQVNFIRNVDHFTYEFEDKQYNYFPDFYLPDSDTYIEIKGYYDARSRAKAEQFSKKLLVYTKVEMQPILKYVCQTYGEDFIKLYE